jgi:PAS domain S-box-containing protein
MKSPLRILHLEDSPQDTELIQAMLEADGIPCQVTRVDSEADFSAALEPGRFDLILTDYTLPSFDGMSALTLAVERCPEVPFLFVSGTLGEELAIETLKIGATDYILKHRLSRLVPAVQRALRESEGRAERRRAQALLSEEKRLLEMIARGNSFSAVSNALCELVEKLSAGSLCSILLLRPNDNRLWHAAAPSLPKGHIDAIEGLVIGNVAGSCGTAAYRKETVLVSDIAEDPLWSDYRDVALSHGLRACSSTPILAPDGRVLGTFAVYYRQPRAPTASEQNMIDRVADLASIAIERKRAEEERQAHLWFLEKLDLVTRAIQGTHDLEQMMSDVLETVLAIFNCDRAWLVYPCDPDAASWHAVVEHTRPEFPGVFALAADLPVDKEVAAVFTAARASTDAVIFGPGCELKMPAQLAERFTIRSQIAMAVYPKLDQPYLFGLHQCSQVRVWTPQEQRLFQEIGGRLADALATLSLLRSLRDSERKLEEAQRVARVGWWERDLRSNHVFLSDEVCRVFGVEPVDLPHWQERWVNLIHPEDRARTVEAAAVAVSGGPRYDVEYRVIRSDGAVRVVHSEGDVTWDESGRPLRQFGILQDITELRHAEYELRRTQSYLTEAERLSHTGTFAWDVSNGEIYWSQETFRIFEYDTAIKPAVELVLQRIHPEDRELVQQVVDRASQEREPFDFEHRLLMPDGSAKYLHVVGHASAKESGNVEFVGAVTDITERKRADERIRRDEAELRQLINFVPEHVLVMEADGTRLYENQAMRDYFGTSLQDIDAKAFFAKFVHPDDAASGALMERERAVARGNLWQAELRFRRKDGEYRWFLIRSNPLRDGQGNIIRRYATATDIEDRKRAEERVQKENVALREEIDKASMFEEIVGSSAALKDVLSRVSQVAPTDATVLLTGETGAGKELIARAIHKKSRRSGKAFVSVNCAAIPPALIGSELFGHEKGAFTGALQRRLGRFELAEGGSIFLDEIGEIPPETQTALLRVLQEREFERVGGTRTIRADIRVIAATNRDLKAAMSNGTFRSDLYYRLQVFPIEIRSLRERKEDIPLLVEYFLDRYASKMGKRIRSIKQESLDLLRSYSWPGNIRELQNVVERAVIVSESDVLWIDESWLSIEPGTDKPATGTLSKVPPDQEKEIIEAALTETQGRVSGPSGAARKLGIPSTTLESRIRSLKINKHRFR